AGAITDYCDMVLERSHYPDYFPQSYDLEYSEAVRTLVVDYQLPARGSLSTLKEVRYVASRDALEEKHMTEAQLNKLYDSVMYQIALRTVHELYESDLANVLDSVVFNGYVTDINPATGNEETACIMSLQT